MNAIEVTASKDKVTITIDTSVIMHQDLSTLVAQIQLKILALKTKLNEQVIDISEKTDNNWWEEHKDQFLSV